MLLLLNSTSLRYDHLNKLLSTVCRPLCHPQALLTMPARNHADGGFWLWETSSVKRRFSLSGWGQRSKTKLDIRLKKGTRQSTTLDIDLVPANSKLMQESVEKLSVLVIGAKKSNQKQIDQLDKFCKCRWTQVYQIDQAKILTEAIRE